VVLWGCGVTGGATGSSPAGRPEALRVVASTTVLADLVAQTGGDLVQVSSLVPKGAEVHTFDPSPSDLTELDAAAVVFANGLGLDEWLAELAGQAGTAAPVVRLGEDLPGVTYREGGAHEDEPAGGDEDPDEHADGARDPHVWLNVAYAELYVDRIADALADADPAGSATYQANADAYAADLDELHADAIETFEDIPEEHRVVVSYHDAFGYFADAYGLTVVDTVVDAPGQDPSAGDVAALIDEIRARGVRAILAESQFPTDVVDRIADETDATVVAGLFSDTLGEPPNDTFVAIIRHDVEAIADALR
jgi:ABC-type Zn uptake system ZnuABC Zn-binding protein ZnuA